MVLNIEIISEGCDDKGRHGSCGIAFIKINGKNYAKKRRGYNVVVVNANTGMKHLFLFYDFIISHTRWTAFLINGLKIEANL